MCVLFLNLTLFTKVQTHHTRSSFYEVRENDLRGGGGRFSIPPLKAYNKKERDYYISKTVLP